MFYGLKFSTIKSIFSFQASFFVYFPVIGPWAWRQSVHSPGNQSQTLAHETALSPAINDQLSYFGSNPLPFTIVLSRDIADLHLINIFIIFSPLSLTLNYYFYQPISLLYFLFFPPLFK